MAATAIVGRQLDTPVINLGFSGNGRMEIEMADLLAELDPSIYVLDCVWNMTPNELAERVEPFVKRLRQAHATTPILLAQDSNVRDICPTDRGRVLQSIYDKMTSQNIKGLHFLSNRGMLGTDGEGTVDACHPNDLGMARQADVFVGSLRPILAGLEKR